MLARPSRLEKHSKMEIMTPISERAVHCRKQKALVNQNRESLTITETDCISVYYHDTCPAWSWHSNDSLP